MPIPKVLALDVSYDINKEELEKTVKLNLNIDKQKFEELNIQRKDKQLSEITLEQIQKLIYKGKVEYNNDDFHFNIEPNKEEEETYYLIQPLLQIDVGYFKGKNTHFLHLAPEFSKFMEQKNYTNIVNGYYKNIREIAMIKDMGEENYKKIKSGEHKYSIVFKALLNEPLKQINELFLPKISSNNDNIFYIEKSTNEEIYKYNMYIPETYIWDIPVDMTGKLIKVNSVEYTIRYLTIDEINNNSQVDLLQDSEYLEKLGETITNKIVDLNNETAFENNWSNDDIKENNANIEINLLPKLIKDESGDITLTSPGVAKEQLLKLFFGINSKFFEQKIRVNNSDVELTVE